METSTGLSNCVFFYNCKLFAFRACDEHRNLDASQFEIGTDPANGLKYVEFKHKKVETKTLNILNRRKIQDALLKYMKNILILYQETVHFTEDRWKKLLLIFSLEKR
jgi:hypothetical protein